METARCRVKLDDAETMLLEAMRRSPNDPRLLYEYAQLPAAPPEQGNVGCKLRWRI